ncbi:hypothetical protein [Sandaracinus amylolyticus]|uniref:hypothetical protein n=1 Tax=Sandaracinus amylolyticus TaxID=927083 RepID=UPI001F2727F1|nr:hypothetical protein [Sandaracinus amylolyticus]UJR86634.1 Hypothetical protein I5071_87350 [Sandaracinus amylolyticus]
MRSSLDDALGLDHRDLLDKDAGRRFLDFYGDEGIRLAISRYGLEGAMRRRGYDHFELETRAADDRHTLLVFGRPAHEPASEGETGADPALGHSGCSERHRLIELVVRRDRLVVHEVPGLPKLEAAYDVLTVDWLLLQDPLARFTEERPRLPGQDAPGLGIGERVLELLYRMVERLNLHAMVTVAEYFHNAVLYARELPFFDPSNGGRLRALEATLMGTEKLSLAQASWAIEWGCVRGADDAVMRWKGEAQVRPFAPELTEWMSSEAHVEAEARAAAAARFVLDRAFFEERWRAEKDALEGRVPAPPTVAGVE